MDLKIRRLFRCYLLYLAPSHDLTKASDIIRSRTFDAFFPLFMVAVLYFVISWLLMLGLGCIERYIDPRVKRRQVKQVA